MTKEPDPKEIKKYPVTFTCQWGGSPKCLKEWTVLQERLQPPTPGTDHGICPPCSEIFTQNAGLGKKKPE